MKAILSVAFAVLGLALASPAGARELHVEVTNLTNGTWFTPLLLAGPRPGHRSVRGGYARL